MDLWFGPEGDLEGLVLRLGAVVPKKFEFFVFPYVSYSKATLYKGIIF